ncbi:MAG: cysteine--tRNA ligase [Gammaproteobacteria bacterium]|nr:cysteine--tRNA ligase [Gammaproteobacteria bacterium]
MDVKFYNTLTAKKEPFTPVDDKHLKIYVCGPTVYARPHIGNARPRVVFDLLARFLKVLYPKVTYVSNITDIDDKINDAALKSGKSIQDITNLYRRHFDEDMAALNCLKPDIEPTVTDNIDCIIETIQNIIDKDHAYVAEDHVLFSVDSFSDYGKLSGRTLEDQKAGARVAVVDFKKHPGDFVLWKPSTGHEPGWESPWGFGRPGWHIECTANIIRHLGMPIDIHAGGTDLVFPHHENELAQGECCSDVKLFSKYWMHNGFINVNSEKMSKSIGNILLIEDLLETASGEAIRLAILSTHYRQPIDWRDDTLTQATANLNKIHAALSQFPVEAKPILDANLFHALADDLNTPLMLTEIYQLCKKVMSGDAKAHKSLVAMTHMLGLGLQSLDKKTTISEELLAEVEALIAERKQAKLDKNYQLADDIRQNLTSRGIEIQDKGNETTWSWKK